MLLQPLPTNATAPLAAPLSPSAPPPGGDGGSPLHH
jgi:hypothetical protein